jgi:hypothetical protein
MGVTQLMLTVGVLTILTELAIATRFFEQLAFHGLVVAVGKLVVKLLLQTHLSDVIVGEWLVFRSELMFSMSKMATGPTRTTEAFDETRADISLKLHVEGWERCWHMLRQSCTNLIVG